MSKHAHMDTDTYIDWLREHILDITPEQRVNCGDQLMERFKIELLSTEAKAKAIAAVESRFNNEALTRSVSGTSMKDQDVQRKRKNEEIADEINKLMDSIIND